MERELWAPWAAVTPTSSQSDFLDVVLLLMRGERGAHRAGAGEATAVHSFRPGPADAGGLLSVGQGSGPLLPHPWEVPSLATRLPATVPAPPPSALSLTTLPPMPHNALLTLERSGTREKHQGESRKSSQTPVPETVPVPLVVSEEAGFPSSLSDGPGLLLA